MILRDPAEMALNNLHVALRKAADQYQHTAGISDDPSLTSFFRDLAAQREQMASTLEEHIRAIGLPRMPHTEREGLEKLITTVKAALSTDSRAALLNDQEQLEQQIAQTSTAALQEQLSPETQQFVRAVAEHVIATQSQVAELKRTLQL